MLQIFPENTVNVTYRQNKISKELISLSLFPRTTKENNCSIKKCNRRWDICESLLVVSTEFACHATKHKHKIRGFFNLYHKKYYLSGSM